MAQTGSGAPVNSGTAPATAGADTNPSTRVDSTSIGSNDNPLTNGDGISSASLGAGDPIGDFNSVRLLNQKSGNEAVLGLPAVSIHDPFDETGQTSVESDGGNSGGAAGNNLESPDTASGTANGAVDTDTPASADTPAECRTDDPDQPEAPIVDKSSEQASPRNPRDASPFKNRSMDAAGSIKTENGANPPPILTAELETSKGPVAAGGLDALNQVSLQATNHELNNSTAKAVERAVNDDAAKADRSMQNSNRDNLRHRQTLFHRLRHKH